MIKIGSIGYNCSHSEDFYVDWKNGPGAYILLLVKTPSEFTLGDKQFTVNAGSVVIISPDTPTFYKPSGKEYADDWFFFETEDDGKGSSLKDLGIPTDCPIQVGAPDMFSSLIFDMTVEFYSSEPYHDEIVGHYTEIFFKRLSRALIKRLDFKPGLSDDKKTELASLRSRIYSDPASVPSVACIADELSLSISGLEHLYKKAFGTSVISDIVNSRINYAKKLLMSTKMQITDIAEKCGYNSAYSFMRQFKIKTGTTPSVFRKFAAYGAWSENENDTK